MNRPLYWTALLLGLAIPCWIGAGYVGQHHPLALAMTVLIAAFYLMGALELHRFQQATATLSQAVAGLHEPPATLAAWLDRLHPTLRNAVRLRIEGERGTLPAPSMAPYLAGLLVLLGMLGTFLGMVVTLNGTGLALDTATDVQAIRASLAAPVKGLGLAFGTSVAGVAASAMLGLMSALCRRARLQAAQGLETKIATVLHPFSRSWQRAESLRLLQQQAQAMPALVDRLQAMIDRMEQRHEALDARLAEGQARFHGQAEAAYTALAASVDRSLRQSLTDSARAAGAAIQPAVEAAMAGIAREATSVHEALSATVQQQLQALSAHTAHTFEQRSAALVQAVGEAHRSLQAALASQDEQRLAAWTQALDSTAAALLHESQAQAGRTIAEVTQLAQAAAEAPRAAAEVMAELRQKLSDSLVRDNAALEERRQLMETVGTLLAGLNHAAAEQRGAIDALVASTAAVLEDAGRRFAEQVQAQGGRLNEVAAQVTGSAVEVASLGEAFGAAVQRFSESNDQLMAQLQRIEASLGRSIARSDEQLAYYVAQAREVIDLSIMSQKQIVEDLQQLSSRPRAAALDEA